MTRTRLTAVLLAAATLGAGAVPTIAAAAAPRTVKAGSTGSAQLDDICRQMADLINEEISAGNVEESQGHFGEANAWFAQASDHISRSQSAGCVMRQAIRRPSGAKGAQVQASSSAATRVATSKAYGPRPSGGTVRSKKITATAGGGKGQLSQGQCSDIARWTNEALAHQVSSAQAGDPGAAAGWHQNANELLATGRAGGCSFKAV